MARADGRTRRGAGVLLSLACCSAAVACSEGSPPITLDAVPASSSVESSTDASMPADGSDRPSESDETRPESAMTARSGGISVVLDSDLGRFDRRVLGSNVAAWEGPDGLANPEFRTALVSSGVTHVRMPGGSWSNSYDWLGCEEGDQARCQWPWAARPSDFVDLLQTTGLGAIWTVSINETAEQAAAAVAFFNGAVGDETTIGIDRGGVDWGTVGQWAQLRVEHGHPNPVGIQLWEVGNEVYGATQESGGADCASFGWEDVWTCDGTRYIEGDDRHDGFLEIREAMLAVDDSIEVGAVGVLEPNEWGDFGNEVIAAADDSLDFYVVHQYGFDHSASVGEIVRRPRELWSDALPSLNAALEGVPIAVTEHNLVAFDSGDTERSMTLAVNAFFLAKSIGELVRGGVPIANQWSFASGTAASGTNYGLIDGDTLEPFPSYFSMFLWSRFGDDRHEVVKSNDSDVDALDVHAATRDDGTITTLVINASDSDVATSLELPGLPGTAGVTTYQLSARRPIDESVTFNGAPTPSFRAVVENPPSIVEGARFPLAVDFPAWSISLLEVTAATPKSPG
jgi:hypothetical protein